MLTQVSTQATFSPSETCSPSPWPTALRDLMSGLSGTGTGRCSQAEASNHPPRLSCPFKSTRQSRRKWPWLLHRQTVARAFGCPFFREPDCAFLGLALHSCRHSKVNGDAFCILASKLVSPFPLEHLQGAAPTAVCQARPALAGAALSALSASGLGLCTWS